MSLHRAQFLAFCVLLAPSLAFCAEQQATLVFTGDNGGEVAPCG